MISAQTGSDDLVLGWRVNHSHDPQYWIVHKNPRAGLQKTSDLFSVAAPLMATHTAIIAQSGSGKSFFLGRVIEEILLRSQARCLILDPNADFRRVNEVESESLWDKAAYNRAERRGRLPHEHSRDEFDREWSKVPKRVRAAPVTSGTSCEPLQISWPSLSMAFLSEDVSTMQRSELYHCHAMVQALARLLDYKFLARPDLPINLINEAQRVFHLARKLEKEDLQTTLEKEFSVAEISSSGGDDPRGILSESATRRAVRHFNEIALTVSEYVSEGIERFYFGKARELEAAGMLRASSSESLWNPRAAHRLDVVDLASVTDRNTRLLIINSILTTEWERARGEWNFALGKTFEEDQRVPLFIVVDEAHNLIPNQPRTNLETALREQFRTIVAEGRKYGLFLIVVSQRPDKLDPLVVSECENRALMRLRSTAVLEITRTMLGLDDSLSEKDLRKTLDFETGRVLLTGSWAPDGHPVIYAAARRTVEGGRNLRAEHWAVPSTGDPTPKIAKRTKKV